jgi:hypothetical protein
MRAGHRPIIAMLQTDALPGSARGCRLSRAELLAGVLADARIVAEAGVDGLMIQNLGDLPVGHSVSPAQIAWMTLLAAEVRRSTSLPLGLNFLENDAAAMVAVASAAELDFVRLKVFVGTMVTPFGLVSGCAHLAQATRTALGCAEVAFFADVHDRTGVPLGGRSLIADVREAVDLGGAEALVLTGTTFEQSLDYLGQAQRRFPAVPRLLGGSSTLTNLAQSFKVADAIMVSSSLKNSSDAFGRFVPAKVEAYMAEVRRLRSLAAGVPTEQRGGSGHQSGES